MSTTVDQRVVEMQFDNKNFEKNVSNTMSALDKLKQALRFTGMTKGFEDVSSAAGRVNMSGLGNAVETVGLKFSAMYTVADQALRNITNSAMAAGKKIVSALTIEPVKTGFQEYETQIGAVQTILANTESKGSTLQDVNAALDNLNTYADKTIYNFTEMTKNIGTFTAAGIDLDASVSAIKGIANLAAVSGSTSQQASTAMYQLSQALASGKVTLMDWNSVVNAGMGGQVFQEALKRTATQMGTDVDAMIEKFGSFRESLTQGEWLTADVLTETLTQLSGAYTEADLIAKGYTEEQATEIVKLADTAVQAATKVKTFTQLWDTLQESVQSGWTSSWEILVGDFEESKSFLTEISDALGEIIGASSDARNAVLEGGLSSGWKQFLSAGISDENAIKESITNVAKAHNVAFEDMIEKEGSFDAALKKGLKDGTISADMLSESVFKLGDKIRGMTVEERKAAGYTADVVESLESLEKGLKDGTVSMDDFVDKMLKPSGRENIIESLWNAFNAVMAIVKPVKEAFTEIFPPITAEQLYNFTEKLKEFTSKLILSEEQAGKLKSTFKGLFAGIDIVFTVIKSIGSGLLDILGLLTGFGGGVLDMTESFGDWVTNLRDGIKETNIFGKAISKATGFITNIVDKVKAFGRSIKEGFVSDGFTGFVGFLKIIWSLITKIGAAFGRVFGSIGNTLTQIFSGFDIGNLLNVGLTSGILLGVKKVVSTLKDILDEGGGFLENITESLGEFKDGVLDCFGAIQNNLQAGTLEKIAKAIGVLAVSILLISFIDPSRLSQSLGAIAVLFVELMGALKVFTMFDKKGLKGAAKAATMMLGMSAAILILAAAMKTMSSMDFGQVLTGLIAIGVLMAEMSIFLRTAKFDKKMMGSAMGIVMISSAMVILAKAVANLGAIPLGQLIKGVTAIGGLCLILGTFVKTTGKAENVVATGFAMVMLGTSMKIFASAVKSFADMKWGEIVRGLVGMSGALIAVMATMKLMPKGGMIGTGIGLTIVAASLLILSSAMKSFAAMDKDELSRGLLGMGFALLTVAVALKAMQGSIGGSAALIIAAGALAIMAPVLKTLGKMSGGQIAKSLIALAGAFAVIGIAGAALSPVVGTILALGAAFALLGVGMIGIGAGLALIAAGVTALYAALAVGATAIVAAVTEIVVSVVDLIPRVARKLGEGIVELAKVLGEYAPQLADSLLVLIVEVLRSLADHIPEMVEILFDFVIGIIDAMAVKTPELLQAVVNLIMSVFEGVTEALRGIETDTLVKGLIGMGLISALMIAVSAMALLVPSALVGIMGIGLVIAELALVIAAIGALAQLPGLEWLIGEGGDFLQKIGTAIGQFLGGIAGGFAEGVSAILPQIGNDLSAFMINAQPFIEGAKSIDAGMMEGVQALAKTILILTAAEIVQGLTSWLTGGSSLETFGEQLGVLGGYLNAFVTNLGEFGPAQVEAVTAAANAISAMAQASNDIPNEGGWISKILGENSLATFGEKLPALGTHLSQFVANLGAFGSEQIASVQNAATAIATLADIADDIPNEGGWVAALFGDNGLAAFGEKLPGLGEDISGFANNISGVNTAKMSSVMQQIKKIVEVAQSMVGVDFDVFEDFADGIDELGDVNVEEFLAAFKDGVDSAITTMADLVDSMLSSAEDKAPDFVTMGELLIGKLGDGASNSKTSIGDSFALVLSGVVTRIRNTYIKFYQAGSYLVEGFANGISQNTYKAKAKAQAMAAAAAEAAATELDEHSPSRVGYRIGDYFGIAFVNGISDWVSKAYKTSAEMASSAREGLGSAIGKVANMVETDVDTQPTIRPILDLSDVRSGVKTMDGLLDRTSSVGVLADVSSISYSMNTSRYNPNGEVVSAIDNLGKQMGGIKGNTYNLNGISYNDGTDLADAIQTIVRYAQIERRV